MDSTNGFLSLILMEPGVDTYYVSITLGVPELISTMAHRGARGVKKSTNQQFESGLNSYYKLSNTSICRRTFIMAIATYTTVPGMYLFLCLNINVESFGKICARDILCMEMQLDVLMQRSNPQFYIQLFYRPHLGT